MLAGRLVEAARWPTAVTRSAPGYSVLLCLCRFYHLAAAAAAAAPPRIRLLSVGTCRRNGTVSKGTNRAYCKLLFSSLQLLVSCHLSTDRRCSVFSATEEIALPDSEECTSNFCLLFIITCSRHLSLQRVIFRKVIYKGKWAWEMFSRPSVHFMTSLLSAFISTSQNSVLKTQGIT